MQRTLIAETKQKIGEKVEISGWAQTIRDQGKIIFIIIRDVSGIIQTLVTNDNSQIFKKAKELTQESVISIVGIVKNMSQAPGGIEIEIESIDILSESNAQLPIPVIKKGDSETSLSKRLDWRWIDLRKPENLLIFKVWSSFERGIRDYFSKEKYIQIYSPSFMGTASESGATVFEVKYFDKKAYLAQSPQFYKQAAMASGFEKVFILGPVFRAEPSYTTRHVTEFTGLDFEISFIQSHFDIMAEEEKMLVSAFEKVKNETNLNLEIPSIPFPKVTMKEGKEKLKKIGIKVGTDYDLNPEEERKLSEIIKKETGSDFMFVTDWPKEGRPFYHMRDEKNLNLTKSFDLLYRGIEITTGSQREHRLEILKKQAIEKKMNLKSLEDYFNFFKFGCPPHGGVGVGPARIIMKLLNLESIKEAIFFPRDVKRLTP